MESKDTDSLFGNWSKLLFLATRCDQEYLELYLAKHPKFISELKLNSQLNIDPAAKMFIRLHELGLLPEHKRLECVKRIKELSVEVPDASFLSARYSGFITKSENEEILEYVKTHLLPNLEGLIEDCKNSFYEDDDHAEYDPRSFFDDLIGSLEKYRDEFIDVKVYKSFDVAIQEIEGIIEQMESDIPADKDNDSYEGGGSNYRQQMHSRSIFDDVDA